MYTFKTTEFIARLNETYVMSEDGTTRAVCVGDGHEAFGKHVVELLNRRENAHMRAVQACAKDDAPAAQPPGDMFKDAFNLIEWMLTQKETAVDFAQALTQQARTTKLDRRERALAYLLDNFTGCRLYVNTHERASAVYRIADALKKRSPSAEVQVACDRTIHRMSEILNNPEESDTACVACGELIKGHDKNHKCDPKKIVHKDAAMMNDDTVREIS